MGKQKSLILNGQGFLGSNFSHFLASSLDALGAGLNPLSVIELQPLEVRIKPGFGGLHGVGPLES
jgi:hypothetical protein